MRDHDIFKIAVEQTVDVMGPNGSGDGGMYKQGEQRGEWHYYVVAENEDIARAWATSGSRRWSGKDQKIVSIERIKLAAVIQTTAK